MSLLNVIYMHSHDTGRQVRPYGFAMDTPHMQRFAEQGVVFRQAFCAGPTCSPSRAALMTGQPPHCVGMMGLAHRGFGLADYGQTWFKTFREAGYHTVLSGFEHVGLRQQAAGGLVHETDLKPASFRGEDVIPVAEAFLEAEHDRPFFMDIGVSETHRTGKAGDAVQWHNGDASPLGDPRYVRPAPPMPDAPATRVDMADFGVCVHRLDAYYGRILQTLERTGLAEHTVVIITTDHGIAFPGIKCNLTDHGIGVLLMMRGPERLGLHGGKVVDAMVSHTDVYPTLCDWLGMPVPGNVRGRSLRPVLDGSLDAGQVDALHEAIFAEVTYHAAYEPKRSVRTGRYKYIRHFANGPAPRANTDDSVSKQVWRAAGWYDRPRAQQRLYDLMLDPNETANLAYEPEYGQVVERMRGRLDAWMRETDDPLLDGPVALPAGGVVNRWSDASPGDATVSAEAFDPREP